MRGRLTFELEVRSIQHLSGVGQAVRTNLEERPDVTVLSYNSSRTDEPYTVIGSLEDIGWARALPAADEIEAKNRALQEEPDLVVIAVLPGEQRRLVQGIEDYGVS